MVENSVFEISEGRDVWDSSRTLHTHFRIRILYLAIALQFIYEFLKRDGRIILTSTESSKIFHILSQFLTNCLFRTLILRNSTIPR